MKRRHIFCENYKIDFTSGAAPRETFSGNDRSRILIHGYQRVRRRGSVQGYYRNFTILEKKENINLFKVPDRLPESLALPCMKLSQLLGMKPGINLGDPTLLKKYTFQ